METMFIPEAITYTGRELNSRFISSHAGFSADAAVAWIGPCSVPTENLVDNEDRERGETIRAAEMLHLIVQVVETDLLRAVFRQRLLAALVAETLAADYNVHAVRRGDDLFVREGKLTVSIATGSSSMTLIHFGINVDPAGAPVRTADLSALGVDAAAFAERLLAALADEESGARHAAAKVRPVE